MLGFFRRRRSELSEVLEELRQIQAGINADRSSSSSSAITGPEVLELIREALDDGPQITAIRDELRRLRTALAEGIEHEERRERRIQATVRRARRQLEELGVQDAGLEAEFDGLHVIDGDGGDQGELLPVSEGLEEGSGAQASSIAGVSVEQLQRARGF